MTGDEFYGKSKTNPYGDFVLQVDHSVGLVLEALEKDPGEWKEHPDTPY
ncbi:MAG: hypothetical protein GY790_00635 [Bacteroidetes bacterium]|nr:hypothetical protein [Bacteroidota bacterium]